MASKVTTLLLDEMALAQRETVNLPLPIDRLLVKLVEWIIANPVRSKEH